MPTRNVVLTDHDDNIINVLIRSGRYHNASEVLREGIRLVTQREALDAAKLEALQKAAAQGFDDPDAGRFIEIPGDRLEDYIADLGRKAASES
ncbi:MAG: type II toxin-antitoxin system ParD family antitoxin [Alphaproteobacteria bacterium]|nr:type II toxin-antitoxin system ParD family antitoxin [Alphaproteobacteria bacterium]